MDLGRLIEALVPTEVVNPAAVTVQDLALDSRAVEPGALFFCVRGQRSDGHRYAAEVVARGAVALVVEEPVAPLVPQLVVADSRRAMAVAAATFFEHPSESLALVGITGTNGKTTTSFLLFAMLAAAGRRPGLLGTIESRVGGERRPALRTTPEAIDLQRTLREMVDVGDRSCALEATSHGAALGRLDELRFEALVFTNLSHDHLDLHGTLERYYEAKRSLFFARPGQAAAVNVGDDHGRRLADELRAGSGHLVTFGLTDDAEIRPEQLELSAEGAAFTAGGLEVRTRLLGSFNVENVLAAIAAGRILELGDDAIVAGIEAVRGVPGRFESVDEGQPFTVVVHYAHTPDSLANALRTARELTDGRVLCVFGCGGDRDREKRPLMGEAAAAHADLVIVTSDNPRGEDPEAIATAILRGAGNEGVEVELDRRRAIERALALASSGDIVVIAGKGHERGQEIAGEMLPFDDRVVVREALGSRV